MSRESRPALIQADRPAADGIGAKVRLRQYEQLCHYLPYALSSTCVVMIAVCLFLRPYIDGFSLLAWAALMVLVIVYRGAILIFAVRRRSNGSLLIDNILKNLIFIGVLMAGVSWALLPALLYPRLDPEAHFLVHLTVVGITAGGMATLSFHRKSAFVFILFICGGMMIGLARAPETHIYNLYGVLLLYTIFLLKTADIYYHNNEKMLRLQEEATIREQALREGEERFRIIATAAMDGIVMLNDRGEITFWNQAAERMFGYKAREIIGRDLSVLLVPERYRHAFRKGMHRCLEAEQPADFSKIQELVAMGRNGEEFPIEVSVSAITMQGRRLAVGIIRDITARKQAQAELIKGEKLKSLGVLAGGIAHDFNNILMVILGNLRLAQHYLTASPRAAAKIEEAEKACLSASGLTRQLLTFSKGGDPVRETASLAELIRESAGFILRGGNIAARYHIPTDLWLVDIDKGQMSQVIQNLLINARQAMPEGGTIEISCRNVGTPGPGKHIGLPRGDYVEISVTDSGSGIDGEIIDRIFDPYFSTKKQGSGLGLAITHSIVGKHDGHISVQSDEERGTTFVMYLPAVKSARLEHKGETLSVKRRSCKVLLLDDDAMILDSVGELLELAGYKVITATHGAGGVELYKEELRRGKPVDVVIADLTIPGGMGGLEMAGHILREDPQARIIVSSGYSNDPIMARYREHGFRAALAKPFDPALLERTIAKLLDR